MRNSGLGTGAWAGALILGVVAGTAAAAPTTVNGIRASKDATLFETADGSASPTNAVINSVTLTIHSSGTGFSGDPSVTLHRVTKNWSEGPSSGFNGRGAVSAAGDATWLHTSFNSQLWSTPGGDFVAAG